MLSLSAILRSPRVHGCSRDIKTAFAVYSFEVNKCTEVSRSSREDCSHDSPALFLSSSSLVCYTFVYLSHVMLIWCLCSFLLSITHSFHSKRDDKTLDSYENPRKKIKNVMTKHVKTTTKPVHFHHHYHKDVLLFFSTNLHICLRASSSHLYIVITLMPPKKS